MIPVGILQYCGQRTLLTRVLNLRIVSKKIFFKLFYNRNITKLFGFLFNVAFECPKKAVIYYLKKQK